MIVGITQKLVDCFERRDTTGLKRMEKEAKSNGLFEGPYWDGVRNAYSCYYVDQRDAGNNVSDLLLLFQFIQNNWILYNGGAPPISN